MINTPSITPVSVSEIPQIVQLLNQNELPVEDISEQIDFFAWKKEAEFIGIGGLEQYGQTGLLRSVAILNPHKGQGLGKEWVKELLNESKKRGIEKLFLLTTTAEVFFQRMGFTTIEREVVPDSIRQTSEFQSICPASAAVMSIKIS